MFEMLIALIFLVILFIGMGAGIYFLIKKLIKYNADLRSRKCESDK